MTVYDLAVVGGGPTTLRMLADLDDALLEREASARICVIDAAPGRVGAVWSTSQPGHLRMNVDAGIVDLRCACVSQDFRSWAPMSEAYPKRQLVGSYLAWAAQQLAASPRLRLHRVQGWVCSVRLAGDEWRLSVVPEGRGAAGTELRAKRVLLATGHAPGSVPDHATLSGRNVRHAHVRGAALTAIDVVFDLTIGRGGRWREDDGALEYLPSGIEPECIVLHSRTGQWMSPKPVVVDRAVTRAVEQRTHRLHGHSEADDAWWAVMANAVVAGAAAAGVCLEPAAVHAVWEGEGPEGPDVTDWVLARMDGDLRRARGAVDDDARWWWGRAWSAGYRDVVGSLARGPRNEGVWGRFLRRHAMLERWAFGPPVVTVERLRALAQVGLLRWERGAAPDGAAVIDAVTPTPGILRSARGYDADDEVGPVWQEPWGELLQAGHVCVRAGERGVLTTAEGACVGASGEPTPGLFALGRPTADPIIDHDSLQRRLHPETGRFAAALASAVAGAGGAGGSRGAAGAAGTAGAGGAAAVAEREER